MLEEVSSTCLCPPEENLEYILFDEVQGLARGPNPQGNFGLANQGRELLRFPLLKPRKVGLDQMQDHPVCNDNDAVVNAYQNAVGN